MPPRPRPPSAAVASADGAGKAGGAGREVEWQLTAPDLRAVRDWLERHPRLARLRIEPLPAQQLHDTYLDTEDWRLFRAGFALRLREAAGHFEATLKGLYSTREDVADRQEITERLSQGGIKALAHATGAVGRRVRDIAGMKRLRPLFEVRNSRERFAVRSRNPSADVGEIALDEARFSRGDVHRRPRRLTRVELEVIGHDSAPLEQLASRLRAECRLSPARENKFAVGLRAASLEPPHGAGSDREPAGREPPLRRARKLTLTLLIVRHAAAFPRDPRRWPDDAKRPLTPEGAARARRAAASLKRLAKRPARVLTSPLLRARNTAAILAQAARWPEAVACAALSPGEAPEDLLEVLRRQCGDAGCVAVVGHQPDLGRLLALCLPGGARSESFELKKSAVACVRFEGSPRAGQGVLEWLLGPRILRKLCRPKASQ